MLGGAGVTGIGVATAPEGVGVGIAAIGAAVTAEGVATATAGIAIAMASVGNFGGDKGQFDYYRKLACDNANTKIPTPDDSPNDFTKLRGDQGYRDKDGNIWKKDKLHKDHWDVSDKKGNKVKEVDFSGKQIWPNGPKNKNK